MGLFDDIPISDGSGDGYNPETGRVQLTVRPVRSASDDQYRALSGSTESGDHAFGRYKAMAAIAPRTKEVLVRELSPSESLLWPEAQHAVFEEKFGQDIEKHGPSPAARAWFNSSVTGPHMGDATPMMLSQHAVQDPDSESSASMAIASLTEPQPAALAQTDALADILADRFERAALAQQRKVRPPSGRKEGVVTAFPEQLAIDTATLPRRFSEAVAKYARTGELDVLPILEGALMASGLGLGGLFARMLRVSHAARVARASQKGGVDVARGRMTGLREPLEAPERLFRADYPWGAFADRSGRLLRDIEGRPMTAKYIAGRRVRGGGDEAISAADLPRLAKLLGVPIKQVAAHRIPEAAGKYVPTKGEILLRNDLSARELPLVQGHEVAHRIDNMAGFVSQDGLGAELQALYHLLNHAPWKSHHLIGPQDFGYYPFNVPHELMAEAIRAYLSNPNFIKTVAPKTAAAIRAAWNGLPRASKILQFNALAAGAAGALAAAGQGQGGGSPAGKDDI
jgi:hypothetical protein